MNIRAILVGVIWAFCSAAQFSQAADDKNLLSYVASDCHAAALIRPANFADFKLGGDPLPLLPAIGELGNPLGLTSAVLSDIEVLLIEAWFVGTEPLPEWAFVARFKKPIDVWTVQRVLNGGDFNPVEVLSFKGCLDSREHGMTALHLDRQTIAVGHKPRLQAMLDTNRKSGTVEKLLEQFRAELDVIAAVDVKNLRAAIQTNAVLSGDDHASHTSNFTRQLSDSLSYATLQVDLKVPALRANFMAADEALAKKFLRDARAYLNLIANSEVVPMRVELERRRQQLSAEEIARQESAIRRADLLIRDLIPKQAGKGLSSEVNGLLEFSGAVGMLAPSATSAYYANMRAVATERMKKIAAALERYRAEHGKYPDDIYDAQGKPLLSWRVVLLPYLGYEDLYKQFDLKKGWGKIANRRALQKTPVVYQHPYQPNCGQTLCLRPRSAALPQTTSVVNDPVRGLVLVEVPTNHSPPWSKPSDLPISPAEPMAGIPQAMPYGTLAIDSTGKVHLLTRSIPKADLLRLLDGTALPAAPIAPRTAPK